MAIFRPPLEDRSQLLEPLNPGEQRVADALVDLDDEWTIYLQPRIGQDLPDAIAVHDRFGVCAIEVKDWNRSGYRQAADGSIEYRTAEGWKRSSEQPRYQAYRYRSTIFEQFFALPSDGQRPNEAVRAAVVLPQYSTIDAGKLLARPAVTPAEHGIAVWGGDALNGDVASIVKGHGCPPPRAASIARLRRHLAESQIVADLCEPVKLSPDARNIESNPRSARIRRVRGPAGCGKTFGLAARAARLAAHGRSVLVLSFNVTLANYLRTMVNARCREYAANPARVTCVSFHSLCERVADEARRARVPLPGRNGHSKWEAQVIEAEAALELGFGPKFDAVLIDEGQDFTLEWWNMLRHHVVEPGGEMLLVADPTQDVYEKKSWTDEEAMRGAGFSGPWTELKGSYRMPSDLVPLTNSFARKYLSGELVEADVPADLTEIVGHPGTTRRKWFNIDRQADLGVEIGREVVRLLEQDPSLSPRDVVFLCQHHQQGLDAVGEIEAAGHDVHHIFAKDPRDRGRLKRRFWPDSDGVKGCTVHSFKGWETPVLVMGIGTHQDSRRLAYVAMTRITGRGARGVGYLSVINSDLNIAGFQSAFEQWAPPRAEMRLA